MDSVSSCSEGPAAMSMLSLHQEARDRASAGYHQFLARYSKTAKVVYGFVEGKTDPCYYRGFIEQLLPDDWDIELWPAGNKRRVYGVYSMIDWGRFPKRRICFFVDRDLVGLLPAEAKSDCNIYLTDGYSIENSLATRSTCRRILTEVLGLGALDLDELDGVCDLFETELERFLVELIPITAWIVFWMRDKQIAYINNIEMDDLFSIVEGRLRPKAAVRNAAVTEYLHSQCRVPYNPEVNVRHVESELHREAVYRKYTYGKFVLWFVVEFCRSVRQGAVTLFGSCDRIPRIKVTVSTSNAMVIIGNRGRLPESLRVFLRGTYCTYIEHAGGTEDLEAEGRAPVGTGD